MRTKLKSRRSKRAASGWVKRVNDWACWASTTVASLTLMSGAHTGHCSRRRFNMYGSCTTTNAPVQYMYGSCTTTNAPVTVVSQSCHTVQIPWPQEVLLIYHQVSAAPQPLSSQQVTITRCVMIMTCREIPHKAHVIACTPSRYHQPSDMTFLLLSHNTLCQPGVLRPAATAIALDGQQNLLKPYLIAKPQTTTSV